MRIDATHRTGGVAGRSAAGKSGGGPAFVPAGGDGAGRVNAAAPPTQAAGLEAILALQGVDNVAERRRRAVRRGRRMLDLLESVKANVLSGSVSGAQLDDLAAELSALREAVEPGLQAALEDIELRVRVELAKQGRFPAF